MKYYAILTLIFFPICTLFAQVGGKIDSTFGTNGISQTGVGGYSRTGTALFAADSSIILSGEQTHGYPQVYASTSLAMARFSANGSLQLLAEAVGSFGNDGTKPFGLLVFSSGNVLVGGEVWTPHQVGPGSWNFVQQDFVSASIFNSNGAPIYGGSIGGNPFIYTEGHSMELLPNDNFIWATVQGNVVSLNYFTPTFTAYKTIQKTYNDPYPLATFSQPNGEVYACIKNGGNEVIISKFLPNGTLDSTFAVNGNMVFNNVNCLTAKKLKDQRIALYAKDKVIFLNSDMSFQKIIHLDYNAAPNYYGNNALYTSPNCFEVAPNDKIITTRHDKFGLICYNPDGSLDNTFGTNGESDTLATTYHNYTSSVLLQNDGKVIAYGWFEGYFTLMRYSGSDFFGEVSTANEPSLSQITNGKVYPNPVTENMNLSFYLPKSEKLEMALYSMEGKALQLIKEAQMYEAGQNNLALELPQNIGAGVYLLCIQSQTHKTFVKVVKM